MIFLLIFSNVFETQSETNGTRSHVNTNTYDEMLDCPFSLEELKKVISSLKSGKSKVYFVLCLSVNDFFTHFF